MGARRVLGDRRVARTYMRRGAGIASGKIQLDQCSAIRALWHSCSCSVQYRWFSWFIFVRFTVMADQRPTYTVWPVGWATGEASG
jgi:hypothetical protein